MTTSAAPATKSDRGAELGSVPQSPGWRLRAYWTLYLLTLRQHLHGRRWMVMAVLFLVPALLAFLLRSTAVDAPPVMLEFLLVFMFIPQALLPLVALLYASGIIQDEQEEQTITYLLIRPIPRWALYAVKLVATLTTTVVLVIVFTVLTFGAIYFGSNVDAPEAVNRCVMAVLIHSLAVVTYCSLFGVFSLLTSRILVVGVLYMAFVEGLLANLPFGVRLITVIYHARIIAFRTMDFIGPRPGGGSENYAAEAWQFDLRKDPHLLEHPQLNTSLAALVLASLVCALMAAWLCSRREFHVKTPEKQ